MNDKAGVKCERFEEPKDRSVHIAVPIVAGLLFVGVLFWVYNHVSGGCLEFSDLLSYCEFHTITK